MNNSIYAFSADPITLGHIDIIKRSAVAFKKVVVAIGVNPDKKYMFSLEERIRMAQRSLSSIENVEIIHFKGLLVDYAYENNIDVIIKGVRTVADFDYENILHQIGESQKLGVDTFILFARPELAHVSSSAVKNIQKEHGFIHEYVSPHIKQCLEVRMSNQYIIGITGEIGSGKSYISKIFVTLCQKKGIAVHNIELDHIGHQILHELQEPRYNQIRQQIVNCFGEKVKSEDGSINRKTLGEIVFNSTDALSTLNKIMYTPLLVRIKRELYGKNGLILLNAALIAESDMAFLCNNNVLIIDVDKKTQEKRMSKRGLNQEQIERRLQSQYNFEEKKDKLEKIIERDSQGTIWNIDNSNNATEKEIEDVLNRIINDLEIKM